MLLDVENIELVTFGPSKLHVNAQKSFLNRVINQDQIEFLGLGDYGKYFMDGCRYDESFYLQAGVEFKERWSGFKFPRIKEKQE